MMPFPALVLGSSLLLIAAADRGVPTLNVQPSCRSAAITGMSTGRTAETCMSDENTAHDTLGKQWSDFSADDKSHCLSMITTGGQPSYVELLSCLEMSRDAKRIAQDRPADTLEQPASQTPAKRRRR
jgi:hypothetical protein